MPRREHHFKMDLARSSGINYKTWMRLYFLLMLRAVGIERCVQMFVSGRVTFLGTKVQFPFLAFRVLSSCLGLDVCCKGQPRLCAGQRRTPAVRSVGGATCQRGDSL